MPVIDAQILFSESRCYNCFGELTTGENLILALWRRLVLSVAPTADVSPQGLLAYAECDLCFTEGSMFDAMEMALMDLFFQSCGIATNSVTVSGAGTSGANQVYTKTSSIRWDASDGVWSIQFTGGQWKIFRNVTVTYVLPAGEPFPCGAWIVFAQGFSSPVTSPHGKLLLNYAY
jgi:hypothetical protein